MKDYSGLLLLAVLAVPVILLALYLRKPIASGSVSRDSFAMKAKTEMDRPLGVLPNDAFDAHIRDDAADLPKNDARND